MQYKQSIVIPIFTIIFSCSFFMTINCFKFTLNLIKLLLLTINGERRRECFFYAASPRLNILSFSVYVGYSEISIVGLFKLPFSETCVKSA